MIVRGIAAAVLLVSFLPICPVQAQATVRVRRTVTEAEVMRVHNAAY
ncbi:MAG TPA: hypothetical protein VHY84_05625 [Bryobacteraceae bacterium]|nr:hypothetical protein [Bryobacteraceae bacterium]